MYLSQLSIFKDVHFVTSPPEMVDGSIQGLLQCSADKHSGLCSGFHLITEVLDGQNVLTPSNT